MPSASVGLYLGSQSADAVLLSGSFQHPQLVHFGRIQLPKERSWRSQLRLEETQVVSPQAAPAAPASTDEMTQVAQTLKEFLARLKLPNAPLFAGISSEAVVIRYFQMPFIPLGERKAAVAFEAKKYLPFKLEELTTDFQIVTQKTEQSLMRVIFFGVKSETLSSLLALFKEIGLAPWGLEPASISLLRLAGQTQQCQPHEAAVILSIERDTATIHIARGDLLYLVRNVTIPPSSPQEEGFPQELLEALIQETRVSIDYYRRRFAGEPEVSKALLYAKEMDPQLLQEIASALGGLPVELGLPFRKISSTQEAPSGLAVATGLALRGLERRKAGSEINLLPVPLRRRTHQVVKLAAVEAVAACLLLLVWFRLTQSHLLALDKKLSSLHLAQVAVAGIKPASETVELENARDEQQRELEFLKTVSSSRGEYASLVSQIEQLLPPEGWLRYLFLEDQLKEQPKKGRAFQVVRNRLLKMAGGLHANNRDMEFEAANNFMASLRSTPSFTQAFSDFSLDMVQRGEYGWEEITEFYVTCSNLKEGPPKKPSGGGI